MIETELKNIFILGGSIMASIEFKHVEKTYAGGVTVVPDLNLKIEDKEFVILVGPSGCGKSTTLRMIAGLEEISSGELWIGDRIVNDVAPKDRDIAMVFQSYALYPHMTVYKNMAFGLTLRKVPKAEIDEKVHWAAKILDIEHLLDRKPKALSGGQRQRVALGRAMVRNPEVFLLDEPLSNLDAKLRTEMRSQITKLHKQLGTTFVYVTHDQTEAMTMGDRIVVMKDGIIQQVDTPQNLYNEPCNKFVAGFIGSPEMNFIDAELTKEGEHLFANFSGFKIKISAAQAAGELKNYVSKNVWIGVRPEDIHAEEAFISIASDCVFDSKVELVEMLGSEVNLYLDVNGQKLIARTSARAEVKADTEVTLAIDANKLHIFDKETEKVICN